MQNNPSISYFHRNRQTLTQWIIEIHNQHAQYQNQVQSEHQYAVSADVVSKYIFQYLLQIARATNETKMQNNQDLQKQVEELWDKNEYFMQCLRDYSDNLIYYAFARGYQGKAGRRNMQPKCLIGYYELAKNIVNCSGEDENKIGEKTMKESKIKKSGETVNKLKSKSISKNSMMKQQNIPENSIKIPKQLRQYSQQNIFRLLLIEANFSYIRNSLIKLQNSLTTQLFCKQLSFFIVKRFEYFCKLFSLKYDNHIPHKSTNQPQIHLLSAYFMHHLFENISEDSDLDMSIDQIILCIIYCAYRKNGYRILFSQIIDLYEKECESFLQRERLLDFYNNIFIARLLPNDLLEKITVIINQSKQENPRKDLQKSKDAHKRMEDEGSIVDNRQIIESKFSLTLSGFRCEPLNEEKSLFDMFQ